MKERTKLSLIVTIVLLISALTFIFSSCAPAKPVTEETAASETATEETTAETKAEETTAAEQITITIWDWQAGDPFFNAFSEIIPMYEATHPNIKVERTGYNLSEYDELIKTARQSNTLPDLFGLYQGPQLWSVADEGILFDFTDVIKNDKEWYDNLSGTINFADLYDRNGRQVAVPFDQYHIAMWGFRDVLAEMGKTEEDVRAIKTMDELAKFTQDLKAAGNKKWYMSSGLLGAYMLRELFYGFIGQQTGGKENPGLKAEMGEMSWTEPIFINAANGIKALKQVTREDVLSLDYQTDHYEIIKNHQAWGSIYDGPWSLGVLDPAYVEENLFEFHHPVVVEGAATNTYVAGPGQIVAMLKDNPHKDAVLDFLKFLSTPEAAAAMIKQSIHPAGRLPDDLESVAPSKFYTKMLQEVKQSVAVPWITYTPEIEQALIDNLTQVFQGKITAEKAMENVDKATKDYLESK
ncbi:MAG: extracellular solute-binding protein [Actinobacteria bacterium]|nr:extracellular solute-binding protein [Actinomycetota bacterium]